jgi:hypothetical protein
MSDLGGLGTSIGILSCGPKLLSLQDKDLGI